MALDEICKLGLIELLVVLGLAQNEQEARKRLADPGVILQVSKRKFVRLVLEEP